jgi:hypothetical protein
MKIDTGYDLGDTLWGVVEDKEFGWAVNPSPCTVTAIETYSTINSIGGICTTDLYVCDDHRIYSRTLLFIVKDDADSFVSEKNEFDVKYKQQRINIDNLVNGLAEKFRVR